MNTQTKTSKKSKNDSEEFEERKLDEWLILWAEVNFLFTDVGDYREKIRAYSQ